VSISVVVGIVVGVVAATAYWGTTTGRAAHEPIERFRDVENKAWGRLRAYRALLGQTSWEASPTWRVVQTPRDVSVVQQINQRRGLPK
jgi:hypothetical protein